MTTLYTSNRINGIKKTHNIDDSVKQQLNIPGIKEIYWAEVEDPILKRSFIHRRCFVIEYIDTTYNVFSFGDKGFVNVFKVLGEDIDTDTFIELLLENSLRQLV